jgi:hypothetical protein
MINRESYELAVLHGMLTFNDMRSVGYLKPSNFIFKIADVENSKIFEVLCSTLDFHERLKAFRKLGPWAVIYSCISVERGIMYDYLGVNTPKYCLLILEEVFEASVKEKLQLLSNDALYAPIVQNVFAEIELNNDMDCFEMAENILAYFRKINFELGVLIFEELNENINERVRQINQNFEIDMLATRLSRHCDGAGKKDFIGYLDTIKLGISV